MVWLRGRIRARCLPWRSHSLSVRNDVPLASLRSRRTVVGGTLGTLSYGRRAISLGVASGPEVVQARHGMITPVNQVHRSSCLYFDRAMPVPLSTLLAESLFVPV